MLKTHPLNLTGDLLRPNMPSSIGRSVFYTVIYKYNFFETLCYILISIYKFKPRYVKVAYKWLLVVYKAETKLLLQQKARLLVTLDLSNFVLVGKNVVNGLDGDGGYLSVNVR